MEHLLLIGVIIVIVALCIWTGWQEYRLYKIEKIKEEFDNDSKLLRKHDNAIYGERYFVGPFSRRRENGVFYRLGVIEGKLRTAEDQERVAHCKAEMKKYLGNDTNDDDIDKLYAMAIGLSINKLKEQNKEEE